MRKRKDPDPDPYLWLMDPDFGGLETSGSGYTKLVKSNLIPILPYCIKPVSFRIVKHAFEIIHLLSGENPLQVVVNAIINSGPREDSTRSGPWGVMGQFQCCHLFPRIFCQLWWKFLPLRTKMRPSVIFNFWRPLDLRKKDRLCMCEWEKYNFF